MAEQRLAEDGLPPLREVIEAHGLMAKKSLGQNFLFDLNLTRKIARSAAPLAGYTIIEVGPGPGGLTRALLAEGADHVIAIERDTRVMPALAEISEHYPGQLTVIEADALTQDFRTMAKGPIKIVSNLPYNVGTPLLLKWITSASWPPPFTSLTLMFQKEVAARITAKPGSDDYGRLSIIAQWRMQARKLFDVNRSAFTPPPKVTSSIVQLEPRSNPLVDCEVSALEKVTAAAFGQRRKMLRSSLKSVFENADSVLAEIGINPQSRAEELPVESFCHLANAYSSLVSPRTNSVSPN
jgi:16S rRNA (adenine1518-N6/adenine1519-N6)-dimethyltransferase